MAASSPAGPVRALLLGTLGSNSLRTGVTLGISQPFAMAPYQNLTFYVRGSAALSAGTLIFEEADWDPLTEKIFAGTWSTIATLTLSSVFASAGGEAAYHVGGPGGSYCYAFVRARIGTTVVGGTVTVVARAN